MTLRVYPQKSYVLYGQAGCNDLAPYMVNAYLEDYLAKDCIQYELQRTHLNVELLKHFFKDAVMNDNEFIFDKGNSGEC